MPVTVFHELTATTPDNTSYEIRPSNWNSSHAASFVAAGAEIVGAFSNANGVSFGLSNGQVTASVSAPPSGITVSAGAGAANLASVVFANANGVNFGLSGSTITASASQPSTAGLLSAIGLSDSTNSNTGTGIAVANSNGVSFGFSNNTLTASVVPGGVALSAGASSLNTGTVVFSNSNGVTFGLSGSTVTASVVSPPSAGVAAVAAGTVTQATGTIDFVNSNGVTFGMNSAGQVTATVTPGAAAGIAAIEAGTQTQTSGTLNFIDANNITFGLSGSNSVTASASFPAQTVQPVAFSGSNGSAAFSTLSFGASNGLSFYTTNGSLVGSYTSPSVAGLLSAVGVSAGTLASNVSAVTFSNGNGVSFGFDGTNISASVANASLSVSAGSQVNQVTGLTFTNSNGVSFGLNNGTVSASVVRSVGGIAAGTQTQTSGTMVFSNANGLSFGMSNNSVVTAQYTVPVTTGLLSSVVFSAGTQSTGNTGLTFSNSNGVTFGMNNGTITASVNPAAAIAGGASVYGNSTQSSTGTFNLTGINLSVSGPMTAGWSSSSWTSSSGPTGSTSSYSSSNQWLVFGAATRGTAYANGNTVGAASTGTYSPVGLNFSGAGMVSLGFNSNTLIISGPGTTSNVLLSAGISNLGNTAGSTGLASNQLVFVGGSNVTLSGSTSAGSATVSVIAGGGTGGSQSVQTQNCVDASFSGNTSGTLALISSGTMVLAGGNNITLSQNGQSVTISGANIGSAQTGISGIIAGTQTQTSGTVSFANANGVSFGLSNSSVLTASVVPQSVQTQNLFDLALSGNTLGVMTTVSSGTLVLAGGSNITLSQNGNYVTIIGTSGGGAGGGVALSAGTNSFSSGTVNFSNANGVTFGMDASSNVTASFSGGGGGGVTALTGYGTGNTVLGSSGTFPLSSAVFNAAGPISVGFSNGSLQLSGPAVSTLTATGFAQISTSGSTISIGVQGSANSVWAVPGLAGGYTTGSIGNGVVQVYPAICGGNFAGTRADMYASFSLSTSSNSSYAMTLTAALGLYSRSGSSLSLVSSQSQSYAVTNTSNNSTASLAGLRAVSIPFVVNATPGDYWVAVMTRTASAGANWITAANVVQQQGGLSSVGFSGLFGTASNATAQSVLGFGQYSTTSTAMPSSMAFSQIQGTGTNQTLVPPVAFHGVTA